MLLLEKVTKKYDELIVFKDLSLNIEEGKIYSILGPSGCGKTTILRIIAELEKPDEGKLELDEKKVSYIFQEPRLLPWETVRKNLELVCTKKEAKKIDEYLEITELIDYAASYPKELSGGMKQRVAIMRAFLYSHDILLMDEPFQALDLKLKTKLLKEIYSLHKAISNTIIFVTHNLDEALFLGDKIIVLSSKPSIILESYNIDTLQTKRNFNSKELRIIKENITKLLNHAPI